MPNEIGPLDGRKARRKRCENCFRRKIRCYGGIPCENCKRTNRQCSVPAKAASFTPVFVSEGPKASTRFGTSKPSFPGTIVFPLGKSVYSKGSDRNLPYFFTSFLSMNVLVSGKVPMNLDLLDMAKDSPALRDAIHAICAWHRGQRQIVDSVDVCEGLHAYVNSVCHIRRNITSRDFLEDPSALWTTFLLGLFELTRDSTGANWLSHFLHGTCTILRLQDPANLTRSATQDVRKRTFFLATRIFEIARALIYSSPTFLSEPRWTAALAEFWQGEGAALWHPKEALFDLLPRVSDLSIRARDFCVAAPQLSLEVRDELIKSLAEEGVALRASLEKWWTDTMAWEQTVLEGGIPEQHDLELSVGYAYYHAISIYLSGTYDYHIHWMLPGAPCAPILPRSIIEWHVTEILRLSQELLADGLAGIMLFFPLRVAGARAMDVCSRNNILEHLYTTRNRGFVVAEAFTEDLLELWAV